MSEQPIIDISGQKLLTDGMRSSIADLSAKQLRRAADIKDKIQSLQNELNRIIGASNSLPAGDAPKKKRKMSAAGRRKIAAAQKARWAKLNAKKKSAKPSKRKFSAAARAKIAAAAKARWAKAKAAGKKTLKG